MVETELKKDYAYCEKVIKASSKSFYTAFSKLPKEKARAVFMLFTRFAVKRMILWMRTSLLH